MSKLFDFVDKYIIWFKFGFMFLFIGSFFMPLYWSIPKYEPQPPNYIAYKTYPYQDMNFLPLGFNSTYYISNWMSLFVILLTITFACTLIISIYKKQKWVSLISFLSVIFSTLLIYLISPISNRAANADFSNSRIFVPHIGFYFLLILSILSIIYLVYLYKDKLKLLKFKHRPTKQQQIDDLKKQVEDLQSKIDNQ